MTEQTDPTKERQKLESQAGAVRSRLVQDLDSLTDRRERLIALFNSVKRQANEHRPLLIGMGIGAVFLAGTALVISRVRARRELRRHWLRGLLTPLIADAVQIKTPEQGFVKRSLRRAGGELATIAMAELGRRSLALLPTEGERGLESNGRAAL